MQCSRPAPSAVLPQCWESAPAQTAHRIGWSVLSKSTRLAECGRRGRPGLPGIRPPGSGQHTRRTCAPTQAQVRKSEAAPPHAVSGASDTFESDGRSRSGKSRD